MRLNQRQQIVAIVIIPTLLSLALLVVFLRSSLHEWAIQRWSKDQQAFVATLADRIDTDIKQASGLLRFAAQTPEFASLPERKRIDRKLNGIPEHLDAGKRGLLEELRTQGRFSALFVLTPEGDHYISHPFSTQRSLKKYNLADRPYFQEARKTRKPVISNSFIGADGIPAVAIDIPVTNAQGEIVLHLGGVLHLNHLSNLLAQDDIAPFDEAVLVDSTGKKIADSSREKGLSAPAEPLLSHPDFSAPDKTGTARNSGNYHIEIAHGENVHNVEVIRMTDGRGTRWLSFETVLKTGWQIFLFRQESGVYQEIAPQVKNATFLAAGILLVPSLLGLFMAFRFSRRWQRADSALKEANASLTARVAERTAALQKSEIRHRTLFESTADAVLVLSGETIIDCNPAALSIFGADSREAIVGRNPADLSPPRQIDGEDSRAAADRLLKLTLAEGTLAFEWLHRRLDDGKTFIAEVLLSCMTIDGQTLMQATVRDITARRQAEEELRKLSLAVEQSSQSIVITNTDAEIEYVNKAFVAISGYSREELLGKNPRILQSGQTPAETYQQLWESLENGRCFEGEFINKRKNGEIYTELATFSPIRQANGSISHYLAIKEDITEQKQVAEELNQHRFHLEELVRQRTAELAVAKETAELATQAKSAFLANMSHEIRTPLNAITGLTHLMKRDGVTGKQAERLDKISHAGSHLLSIINDILDLSKIEAGKLTLEHTDVAVAGIAANVISMLQDRAQAKGLQLSLLIEALPHHLQGDPTRISQGLLNYANNAVKFTEHGSVTLHISMQSEDSDSVMVRFEVTDTGPGLNAETQARLFGAFEQADTSITRKHGGTGLGLAITRRLATLMGGESGVVSQEGVGSTFWFSARLYKGDPATYAETRHTTDSAEERLLRDYRGQRVLLVEDDVINREVALELLNDTALSVDCAEDGEQAVALATQNRYALILMDMQMPKMDGLEATQKIRGLAEYGDVPIVAMTANAFVEDKVRCFDAGMDDFIAKPIDPDVLFDTLLSWMSRSRT